MIRLLTRSPVAAKPNNPAYVTTAEVFREVLDRGFDQIVKQEWAQPFEGEQFVRQMKVKRDHGKIGGVRGFAGTVPINRDEDTLPLATTGVDFPWTWDTFTFRRAVAIGRKAQELDDIGVVKSAQRDLLDMYKRTVEYIIADALNRATGAGGGSLVLASDGCYMIDSNRPNPNPDGGTWGNLEATADLTEDTLFEADYNASQQVSPDGTLYPQKIKKMIIPPRWRQKMWKLLNSEKVLGSNNNDANWAAGAFDMSDVIVYSYMTTDQILYLLADPQSLDNELVMPVRVSPNVLTEWGMFGNPDVLGQRLRAEFGLALGSPRRCWRGGLLAETSA